jgi:putative FmdB family regulatory protein
MPIFEYQCQACGHRFDMLQKPGEGVRRKCPECAKLKLRKALTAPSFHLRGSGWRNTAAKDASGGGKTRRIGHTLDSGPPHSHDDHGHDHRSHTHQHGGVTHNHPPGQKHDHKR